MHPSFATRRARPGAFRFLTLAAAIAAALHVPGAAAQDVPVVEAGYGENVEARLQKLEQSLQGRGLLDLANQAHDQADNAARLQRIGLGRKIDPVTNVAAAEEAWSWALTDPDSRKAFTEAKHKLTADGDGADRIADIVLADLGENDS